MITHVIGRLGAAAVLAVGLLVATAVPASAVDATHVEIQSSSAINVHVPPGSTTGTHSHNTATVHVQGHSTTNVCASNSTPGDHIPVSFNSTGGGTIGAFSTSYSDFVIGTNTFKARLNIVSGSATITATTLTITLTINAEFRNCASTTLLCRTNNVTITLTGTNTTGNLHPQVSDTLTVAGVSTLITVGAVPACNVIIRGAIVGHEAVASFNLHATDSAP